MLNYFIHMTQGELLLKYWWLWMLIIVISAILLKMGDD